MNINQSNSVNKLPPKLSKQPRNNRLLWLISSLIVIGLAGYFGWREVQLNAARNLLHDCGKNKSCEENIEALKKLVKAKKSLKFFNLESAHLENAHLENAHLESAHLENAHLENAHLENAHLKNANLSNAHLENAHLENAHLENVNLSNAHLEQANLKGANLKGAHIAHDHLKGAHFNLVDFQGARLYHADFEQAHFHLANLAHTYLYRANFNRANLYLANLDRAYLIESQNLTPAQIKSACNWEKAIYKGVWSPKQAKWVVDEQANQQFIEQLQQDLASNPKHTIDCSRWD